MTRRKSGFVFVTRMEQRIAKTVKETIIDLEGNDKITKVRY
jgi:hypothetical protein